MTQNVFTEQLTGSSLTLTSANGQSVALSASNTGNLLSGGSEISGGGAGVTVYANSSVLPLENLTAGDMAFANNNNTLYLSNGFGWYKIALINQTPSITFASNAEFTMGLAGANTVDLTYTTVEPEGTPVTVTVSNTGIANTSVANVQHFTANNTIRVNNLFSSLNVINGTIRATVSDGINTGFTSAPFIISNATELYGFTSFTFTSADTSGPRGPNLTRALGYYNTSTYSWLTDTQFYNGLTGYAQGVQLWTCPEDGIYRVEMAGSVGGSQIYNSTNSDGGYGAKVTADLTLSKDEVYCLAVGQLPQLALVSYGTIGVGTGSGADGGWANWLNPAHDASSPTSERSGQSQFSGGGGASWIGVYDGSSTGADNDFISDTPLLVAGGGASIRTGAAASNPALQNALLTSSANAGGLGNSGGTLEAGAGVNGNGSTINSSSDNGTGGSGWLTDATGTINSQYLGGINAQALRTGGRGMAMTGFGTNPPTTYPAGGFGGGGAGGWGGSGGGGGYSGGASGGNSTGFGGGGGSSFLTSVSSYSPSLVSESADHRNSGYIIITKQ